MPDCVAFVRFSPCSFPEHSCFFVIFVLNEMDHCKSTDVLYWKQKGTPGITLRRKMSQGSSFEQVPPKQSRGRGNFDRSKGGNDKGMLLYNGACVGRRSGGIRSRKLWTVWQLFCLKVWPRSFLPNPKDSHFNFSFDMRVKLPQQTTLPHHKYIFFQQW